MSHRFRQMTVTMILLFCLLPGISSCNGQEPVQEARTPYIPPPKSENEAPDFVLPDLKGKPVNSKSFLGKITVVNFWATWCGYCRLEIPQLNQLHKKYKDKGVRIVGISLDKKGASVVLPFIKTNPINYSVLFGNSDLIRNFGGFRGLPTTFLIDQEWRIQKKYPGYVDKSVIEKDVIPLLKPAAPKKSTSPLKKTNQINNNFMINSVDQLHIS